MRTTVSPMGNSSSEHFFPQVLCLTLPEERGRQLLVAEQFESVGIRNYEFFPGFSGDSPRVQQAVAEGRVKRYPDCFRCGARDCGDPDCNNVLLPSQVAVALGFQAILKKIANGRETWAAVCEDDIVFAGYARRLLASDRFRQAVAASGLLSDEPTLLRLGQPGLAGEAFFRDDSNIEAALTLDVEPLMSNYFFLVNRPFARLACERLGRIDHTADVIIHESLTANARCLTLRPQLVADRSWTLGEVASLIHPKAHHVEYLRARYGASSAEAAREEERLRGHLKKAVSRPYGFTGSPRCGSHFVSAFLRGNGLDIAHEAVGGDGICAWQYAISSDRYPYITDRQAQSDFFVHVDQWFLYARDPARAIPSLIVENQKAPLSYAFRRDAILRSTGVDLDDFTSSLEQAARSYAHWYLLAMERRPKAVLRVESFLDDCRRHLSEHRFAAVDVSASEGGSGKPYLGYVHPPAGLEAGWLGDLSPETRRLLTEVAAALGYAVGERRS